MFLGPPSIVTLFHNDDGLTASALGKLSFNTSILARWDHVSVIRSARRQEVACSQVQDELAVKDANFLFSACASLPFCKVKDLASEDEPLLVDGDAVSAAELVAATEVVEV